MHSQFEFEPEFLYFFRVAKNKVDPSADASFKVRNDDRGETDV